MSSFITVQELKDYSLPLTAAQWAKIDENADQIATIAEYASQHLRDYMEKDIDSQEYIERIGGNGRFKLVLNNYPVTEISGVTSIDVYGYERSYDASFFIVDGNAGIVEWLDKYRNAFFRNYLWTVTYTAGYEVIPGPIKHATALQVIDMLQPVFRGGGNFSQVALIEDLNEKIVDLLDKYKRDRIG